MLQKLDQVGIQQQIGCISASCSCWRFLSDSEYADATSDSVIKSKAIKDTKGSLTLLFYLPADQI